MWLSTLQADFMTFTCEDHKKWTNFKKKIIKWRHYYVYEASQLARVIHSSFTARVKNDGLDPFIATAAPMRLLYFNRI